MTAELAFADLPQGVRPYAETDRAGVIALIHQLNLFEDAISGDRAPGLKAAAACLDADLARIGRDGGALLVAVDGPDVVGMMCFALDQPQPFLRAEIGPVGWVTELVIDERSRGQGFGTRLLKAAETVARQHGVRRLMIGAIAGNHAARRAYERFGFQTAVIELAKDLD